MLLIKFQQRIYATAGDFRIHEGYTRYDLSNDIAIINLPRPLVFNCG